MTLGRGLYGLPEPELPKKTPSKWRWAIYIPLIFFSLMAASLFTLSFMGGNSPELKENIENYLSQATGTQATIGKLVYAGFYPAMGMAAEDIRFVRKDGDTAGEELARLGEARFAIAFWSVPSGTPKFRMMAVKNASIAAGVLAPRAIRIEKMMIDPDAMAFIAQGNYGGEDFFASIPLKSKAGLSKVPVYMLADEARFEVRAGALSAKGVFYPLGGRGADLKLEELRAGKANPITADILIGGKIKGVVKGGESSANLDLRITRTGKARRIGGDIAFDVLNQGDIFGAAGIVEIWRAMQEFYFGPDLFRKRQDEPYDFSRTAIDADFRVADFRHGKTALGTIAGRLAVGENIAALESLSGDLQGGALSGAIRLDATGNPGKLDAGLSVKGIDYTHLYGGAAGGRADVTIDLKAEGNNGAALMQSLSGSVVVVAGPGEITGKSVALSGGKIMRAMLPDPLGPDDRLHLECGLWALDIKGPAATVKALLVDPDKKTVSGAGTIDLTQGTAEMRLEPQSQNPEFSAPGLAESHPCRQYASP